MNLLYNVLFAWKCTSTHHKLAFDALRHLPGDDAELWRNLFLKHFEVYLEGAKAPDNQFKDFKNHVLHVRENYWGGALTAAKQWYDRTLVELRAGNWSTAVYNAGVLSHYFTDPFQPFHTGQTEAEGAVHRACEWSIAKSYDELQRLLEEELGGYPTAELPEADDWLARMIRQGADAAHPYYDVLIDHYDLERGVKDPPSGLDQEIKECIAVLIGEAVAGFAVVLRQAFDESAATPPKTAVSLYGVLNALTVPIYYVTKNMSDRQERAVVQAMYAELQADGRVKETLPADDREVRRLHAEEVLKRPLEELDRHKPRPAGTKHGEGAQPPSPAPKAPEKTPEPAPAKKAQEKPDFVPVSRETKKAAPAGQRLLRFYLERSQPVEEAPSIGPNTARKLATIGVETVDDLLEADPEQAATRLGQRSISADTISDWQAQARLVCRVPGLRGHDAQLIVGCGIVAAEELAQTDPEELLTLVEAFATTEEGERILRSSEPPNLDEVRDWIASAGQARALRAA